MIWPSWTPVAAGAVLIIIIGGAGFWMGHAIGAAEVQKLSKEHAEASAKAERDARTQESLWQETVNGVARNAQAQIDNAKPDRDAADISAVSLHKSAAEYASKAACGSPATVGGPGPNRAAMVLSDLFERADKRAGQLADYADQLKIALTACNAAYNAIRGDNHGR